MTKGTRIKHGFKRAFMLLFGQDVDTFTSTMLLNIDQLQKKLDKDDFQEDGFHGLLLGNKCKKDNSRSRNDTDANDADIRPIYDEELLAEVQLTAECNIFATGQHHTEQPKIINEVGLTSILNNVKLKVICLIHHLITRHDNSKLSRSRKTFTEIERCPLSNNFSRMEAHCIALELKYQNQALKSGQHGQILNETSNKDKIKKEIDVLEIMNIELEHNVAKLRKEIETLKNHYKDLYDSLKITRSKTIEQTTSLLANNVDLKAQIQEKVFAIAALKNDLRKLKGNRVDTKFAKTSVFGKPVLQSLRKQYVVRQPNAFKSESPQMSKPRFTSQVDMSNNLSRPVTQHYLPKRRESVSAKPDHIITSSESRDSSKNMPRFSSNDMIFTRHRFSPNKTSVVYEKTSPRSDLRWKPTGRIFKFVGLRWIPTGKLFDSCTSKVDSEPPHGSNVDIPNIHECKQTLDVSAGTSINVQKEQSLDLSAEVHQAAETVTTSNELDLLFGSLFGEYFNGENQVVSKSSVVTTTDAS
ncbi:hypothetical protein Tco_0621932 [Tanacetum coccineum]